MLTSLSSRHPRVVRALCMAVAAAAAAYLWAAVFGRGIPGLKTASELDHSPDDGWPDANGVFLVASILLVGMPPVLSWYTGALNARRFLLEAVLLGAAIFAVVDGLSSL